MPVRIPIELVREIDRAVGGDPVTEQAIMEFIEAHYGAINLTLIPLKAAQSILARPVAFIAAAKHFHQARVPF